MLIRAYAHVHAGQMQIYWRAGCQNVDILLSVSWTGVHHYFRWVESRLGSCALFLLQVVLGTSDFVILDSSASGQDDIYSQLTLTLSKPGERDESVTIDSYNGTERIVQVSTNGARDNGSTWCINCGTEDLPCHTLQVCVHASSQLVPHQCIFPHFTGLSA